MRWTTAAAVSVSVLLASPLGAAAEDRATEAPPARTGGILTRSALSGDWGGLRTDLAAKGITFDSSLTQIGQGVVDGGTDGTWEYGGRGDLTANLDTGKLGLWPAGFLTVELEGNWSNSVNGKTGALMAANANQLFPESSGSNVALPNLSFAQFFCRYAGAVVGKLQTVSSGDMNEFAHGKGDTQFFNLAFNMNPVGLVIPYSTLGAGAIVLPTADPDEAIINFNVFSATGTASDAGFDNINGAIFVGAGRLLTRFGGLTGHQLVGGLYSNKRYTSIDQRLGTVINNQPLAAHEGTWAAFYNFDQFLYETAPGSAKGLGLFGRFGASEGDPNPAQYFYSVGVGGKGLTPGRELDQFGLGYFYLTVSSPTLQNQIGDRDILDDEWGFEAYYNFALTPWLLVTADVQVIGPSQPGVSTATVLGFRAQVIL